MKLLLKMSSMNEEINESNQIIDIKIGKQRKVISTLIAIPTT